MQATTVISILTVGVAVASVIANLYIARVSRRTSLEVLRFKASLDRIDASTKLIKELETESERLRIRGWDLLTQVQRVLQSGNSSQYRPLLKEFIESSFQFSKQANVFLDKWATTKGEFSEDQCILLSKLRHECRTAIDAIAAHLAMLERLKSPERVSRALNDIKFDIQIVLSLVQKFILDVSNARKAISAETGA
jgi:hypothetical protein